MSEDASDGYPWNLGRVPPTAVTRDEGRLTVEDVGSTLQEEQNGDGASTNGGGPDPHRASSFERTTKRGLLPHVTHEIRTPLTAMTGIASVLLEGDLDPDQREKIETIRDSGEYALSLVDDILDLAKATSGELSLQKDRIDLEETIESAFDMARPPADEKGLELGWTLGDDVPREIVVDGNHLKQVLVNLLANAVRFTDEGGVRVAVERAGEDINEDEEHVLLLFTIRDTGPGIPDDSLETVFQPFSQLNGSKGSGLGLAICRELVSLMGGTIDVESTPGEGSTFRFTIRSQAVLQGVSP